MSGIGEDLTELEKTLATTIYDFMRPYNGGDIVAMSMAHCTAMAILGNLITAFNKEYCEAIHRALKENNEFNNVT